MSLQVRRPEERILNLSDGDWILVKKYLNAGEAQDVFTRMVKAVKAGETDKDGNTKADVNYDIGQMGGLSEAVEYLLDWSAKDPDGKPIVIRDRPAEEIEASLKSLPAEAFREISKAIDRHKQEMEAELKNAQAGATESPATSTSVNS